MATIKLTESFGPITSLFLQQAIGAFIAGQGYKAEGERGFRQGQYALQFVKYLPDFQILRFRVEVSFTPSGWEVSLVHMADEEATLAEFPLRWGTIFEMSGAEMTHKLGQNFDRHIQGVENNAPRITLASSKSNLAKLAKLARS